MRNNAATRFIRLAGLGVGVGALVLATAFLLRLPLTQDIWPWTGPYSRLSPLSSVFLASVYAAFGLPLLWIFLSRHYRAAVPIAIDVIIVITAASIFMFQGHLARPNDRLLMTAIAGLFGVALSIGLLLWGQRQPLRDQRRTPRLVRYSFVFFVIALLYAGISLALKVPNIFPWPLTPEASVIYGWSFIAAAAYFAYGVLFPNWSLAVGQLLGFLIYDLVLIVPFLQYLPTVPARFQTSLTVYLIVITYSMLLAGYYLFVNRSTRILPGVRLSPSLDASTMTPTS